MKATFTLAHPLVGVFMVLLCLLSNPFYGQQQFDVAITKTTVTSAPVQYGTAVPFNLTIYNQGLDTITNVEIIDHYGSGFEFQGGLNPEWGEHMTIVNAVTTTYTEKIPPSQSRIVTLNLVIRPGDSFDDWQNTAEVVTFTDVNNIPRESEDLDSDGNEDPNDDAGGLLGSLADNAINGNGTGGINDGVAATDEDDHDRDSIQVFDLAITKILDPITGYKYGDTLTFNITVYNQGNMEARVVRVRDIIPEGYIFPEDVNVDAGWSNDPVNPLYTIDVLAPFEQEEISIKLILGTTYVDENAWTNYSEIFSARDKNLANVGGLDADSSPASNSDGERSVSQGDPDDNYIGNSPVNPGYEDDHDPAEPVVFDLALIKERATALSSFNYGNPIEYEYTVQNQGNVDATDIVLYDSLPCGAMFDATLNPDWSFNPLTNIATLTIPSLDASTEIQGILTLTVVPCFINQATAWTNYMEIASATTADGIQTVEIDGVFDTDVTNDPGGVPLTSTDNDLDGIGIIDEDNHDVELLQVYDLALKKELITEGPYFEGQELDFRIRVYNQGNIVIQDLVVEDFVGEGYGYDPVVNAPLGWTNSYTIPVSGVPTLFTDTLNVMEDIFLATEDSVDIFIKLTLELDAEDISAWYNYAHIWVASDTVGNSRFDDADSDPFTTKDIEFAVLPGSPNDNNIFSMGKTADPVGVEEDDHDVANVDYFDLALSKTATSAPTAYGQPVTFDIVVKNEGVQFAHDITIADYLPCGLTFTSSAGWAVNGITGNPEYFYTDTLFAGEEVTIPITLTVEECTAIDADSYRNEAEIVNALDDNDQPGDDQDSTPNNQDPDEDDIDDALISVFDLSLTKSISSLPANFMVGTPVSYNIVITNEGNTPAVNTEITDYLPCGLSFSASGNTGWSEDPITGNIAYVELSVINPGTSVTVPLTLTIGTCTNEALNLENLVEISDDNDSDGSVDDFDSTPDNGDPDEDDIDTAPLDFFDLSLTKTLTTNVSSLSYGQDLEYNIEVTNEGSIPAVSYTVTDYLACGLGFDAMANPDWDFDANTGYVSRVINIALAPGESNTLFLTLTLIECPNPNGSSWNNVAEISDANDPDGPGDDTDSTPENQDPDEDDQDDAPFDVFDLTLSKTLVSSQTVYELGEDVFYNIVVRNEGNTAANGFQVTDFIPCGMSLSAANTLPWMVNIDGYAEYTAPNILQSGSSESFEIILTIGSCDVETGERLNIAEVTNNGIGDPFDIDSTPDNGDPNEDDIDDVSVNVNVNIGSTIGDFVFNDLDGDGIQDGGDPGISDVVVALYNALGDVIAVTETDGNGFYEFTDVPAGDYYIVFEIDNDNLIPTIPNAGTNDNDSNITDENGPGSTAIFTLAAGQDENTIDAGYFECLDVIGVTYYDINEDDVRQSTENGINGLVANLYRRVNGVWVLWDSETTHHDYDTPSDDGIWDFCVPPGTYYMEIEMPPIGLVRVRPFVGGSNFDSDINGANGPNTTPSFTLNPGGSKTNLGAGYYPMATVGNKVWYDENANGIQEDYEAKAEGINVQVYNMNNELIDEALTDSDGIYEVEYLRKEEYYLKFEAPEGLAFTFADASDNEDKDSDVTHAMGINTTDAIAFSPGQRIINVDAGIVLGILPLEWKAFSVRSEKEGNDLKWTTSLEINGEYFEVERRLENETKFTSLQRLEAVGNSTKDVNYQYLDTNTNDAGLYYYRIKQVDIDGSFTYSEIQKVIRTNYGVINTYPNPTSGKVTINGDFDRDELYSIRIINNLGGKVFETTRTAEDGILEIDLSDITPGVYKLSIDNGQSMIYNEKIIKL